MSDQDQPEYGLVYPFVVCESNGGEYPDRAFVAGAQFGAFDQRMAAREPVIEQYVKSGIVRQLDLAAMHHGYDLTAEPWADDEDWTWVSASHRPEGGSDE